MAAQPTYRPAHHPAEDQLASYAAGDMAEAPSLVIATHLALCPACRRQVADYEALGGELLTDLPSEALAEGSLSQTLARLEASADRPEGEQPLPGKTCPASFCSPGCGRGGNAAPAAARLSVPGLG